MRDLFITIVVLLFSTLSIGQKSLTLTDAVVGQWTKFRPESIYGFSWIPNTHDYAYAGGYVNLVRGSLKDENDTILSIKQLNDAVGSQFRYFINVEWKDENTIYVYQQNEFVVYHIEEKAGVHIILPEDGANFKLHKPSGRIAFTIDNNVYVTDFNESDRKTHKITEPTPVTAIEDPNIVSGQAIARSEFGITGGLFWSPKGNYLAFYQKDETFVHDYPLLDIDKYPGELKSTKYPMAGQPSERPKIGIYNLDEEEITYIEPKSDDESYLTNLSWTPNEKKVLFAEVNRGQDHMWLQVYDSKGKFIKTVFEEKSESWVEPERPPQFFTESNDEFLWISERDGFDNFYRYSIDNGLVEQVTKNKFPVKDVIAVTKDELYFTATGENPLNTLVYSLSKNGKQELITTNQGTHQATIHGEGRYVFSNYSSHNVPGRSIILKGDREVKELMAAKNPYKEYNVRPAEIDSIQAEDGTKLYTRMIKPHDFDSTKQYPVLIYVYGGPHAQLISNRWLDGASLWMHWMADQDYIIYTVDNRGSANRGAEFEHVIHRQLGTVELEDQLKGVEYLKGLPFVDADRIAVHGWSFGGFMTGTMLMKAPEHFNVGVAGGLVTDWKFYEVMYGERYMDQPGENEEGYKKASLLNHAEQLEDDLLMIHGTVDDVVVMQHSLSLVQKFVDLGIQVDYFPYPMHKHNVRGKDRVHLMEKVLTYIIDHNK